MLEHLKKGMFRLGLGLSLLFIFIGFYMRSVRMDFLYRIVDGYLIVLPIARLGFKILAVGTLLSLARPLSEVMVGSIALFFPLASFRSGEEGRRFYRAAVYRTLVLFFLIWGFFLLRTSFEEAMIPLKYYRWASLSFASAWWLLFSACAAFFALRIKEELPRWRAWRADLALRKQAYSRIPPAPGTIGASAGFPAGMQEARPGPARFCKRCGSHLEGQEGSVRCGNCGWQP